MDTHRQRGAFVVVEGLDKAGKSTQCTRLVERTRKLGKEVIHMRFPDRTTPIGQMIDSYLKGTSDADDHAIHLLFSANRWEAASKIKEAIDAGIWVIADRYYWSGVSFTMAKGAPNLSFEWARDCDIGLPAPDICFFLDISAEVAKTRGSDYGEERYEKESMQRKVREEFHRLFEYERHQNISIVDASKSLDEVAHKIQMEVLNMLARIKSTGPVETGLLLGTVLSDSEIRDS